MSEQRKPRLLLALTPLTERLVEEQLFAPELELTVVASAADAAELLSLSERHRADAVLLSSELSGLSQAHCARLRARGLYLLGLALDDHNERDLDALGLDLILRPPLELEQLATAVRAERGSPADPPAPVAATSRTIGSAEASERRAGSIVAVVGAAGSPGASECAASLAALAARDWRTLLIELDLLAGSLDLRLGCDPQQGSLLGLIRADENREALAELIGRWLCGGEQGWPPVLLTPPEPELHIDELARPGAIRAALEAAAGLYPLVVCDVGSLLAAPGELPKAARCHREALLEADAVILVLGARDEQLRAAQRQLELLLDTLQLKRERLRLCVNGLGTPGTGKRLELEHALAGELTSLRLAIDAWLPYDQRALARARAHGLPLTLARPRGPYARSLQQLLNELLLPAAPIAREHKTRLPTPATASTQATAVALKEVPLPWRS